MPGNSPNNSSQRQLGNGMMLIAWLILLVLLIIYFTREESRHFNPNTKPEMATVDEKRSLVLKANRNNHFVMTGKINGHKAPLILDTGATNVAIPANMAEKLGLTYGRKGIALTANGEVVVYSTTIDKLELGEIILYDVAAELSSSMNKMDGILLGMSALSQIEFTQRDGMLILRQ